MLTINVDIFVQTVRNRLKLFTVHVNSKFQFVRAAVSGIHSRTVTTK